MISQQEKDETKAAQELPQDLRTRVAGHLEQHAKQIEEASTQRHVALVKENTDELTIIRSVAAQHRAIVRRIAQEIKIHVL